MGIVKDSGFNTNASMNAMVQQVERDLNRYGTGKQPDAKLAHDLLWIRVPKYAEIIFNWLLTQPEAWYFVPRTNEGTGQGCWSDAETIFVKCRVLRDGELKLVTLSFPIKQLDEQLRLNEQAKNLYMES